MIVISANKNDFSNGTLANTSPFTISMREHPIPCSITLRSSYTNRLIQLSTDGGTEYFTPTYDVTSANMVVVTVNAPITHCNVTGNTADTYKVI